MIRKKQVLSKVVADRYELYEEIGARAFGKVFYGRDKVSNIELAIKMIPVAKLKSEQLWRNEI